MSDWRAYVRARLPRLDIGAERESEIVEELAQQLEGAYLSALGRGESDATARAAADAEVPDWQAFARTLERIERPVAARLPTQMRPEPDAPAMGAPTGGPMTGLIQDVRHAVRGLVRTPGFTTAAVATLALGVAAATLVYSLVDGILLKPLPIAEPDRVVFARTTVPNGAQIPVSWPDFEDFRARASSFEDLAAWRGMSVALTGAGDPREVAGRQVTWNLFRVLGVRPVVGRDFVEADDQPDAPRTAVISYGFWQNDLGGTSDVVGRILRLDDRAVEIVGVLPADFTIARQEDVFLPMGHARTTGSSFLGRGNHQGLAALGRLRPGVSVEAARTELQLIAEQLAAEYPDTNSGQGAWAMPLHEVLVRLVRPSLIVLMVGVGAMLLIACVNIANLMVVRGIGREQEIEVRLSLGASRWRVVRQVMTESLLLGLAGGIAGVLIATAAFNAFKAVLPSDQPRIHALAMDLRVLSVSLAVAVTAGLLFGLVPALQAGRRGRFARLRGQRVAGAGATRPTTRRVLLAAQLALALVLLTGAGLMGRTMQQLLAVDPGFEPSQVLSAHVSLPRARYGGDDELRAFWNATLEAARAQPGVAAAAVTYSPPIENSNWNSVFVVSDAPVPARTELPSAAFTPVSPDYFGTMGIRLLAGRGFTPGDREDRPEVVVISESLARQIAPGRSALGRRIKQGWPESAAPWREIVGVVADVRNAGLTEPSQIQVYLPLAQEPPSSATIVVRADVAPASLARAVATAVHTAAPDLPVTDVRTFDQVIAQNVGQPRLVTILLTGFGLLALVIAAVGVFAVAAFSVSQRTSELGLRMALGADRRAVLRLVIGQELPACLAGLALGAVAAMAAGGLLQSLLFGVPPRDPIAIAAAASVIALTTLLACYLPARRATRVDPAAALRMP